MSRVWSSKNQGCVLKKVIVIDDQRSVAESVRLNECGLFDSIKSSSRMSESVRQLCVCKMKL
jgi:hypothetical protein